MAGLKVGTGFISIEFAGLIGDKTFQFHRQRYRFCIDLPDGQEYVSEDLSGRGGALQEVLSDLLSFLSASAEAYRSEMQGRESGNGGLFPKYVMEWAYQNDDEIQMLQCELEEKEGLIDERS